MRAFGGLPTGQAFNADAVDEGADNSLGIDCDYMDGDTVADGLAYGRSAGIRWWDVLNGAITILKDVLLVLARSRHSCEGAP